MLPVDPRSVGGGGRESLYGVRSRVCLASKTTRTHSDRVCVCVHAAWNGVRGVVKPRSSYSAVGLQDGRVWLG